MTRSEAGVVMGTWKKGKASAQPQSQMAGCPEPSHAIAHWQLALPGLRFERSLLTLGWCITGKPPGQSIFKLRPLRTQYSISNT